MILLQHLLAQIFETKKHENFSLMNRRLSVRISISWHFEMVLRLKFAALRQGFTFPQVFRDETKIFLSAV